ncbi:nucleoside triphosphate pyrophosphohydrolase [Guptibacillus algicola]|uniref:nucleoside triphosphate pyrophosphohydrolase n=1 Tax=Guptibacillus algicola TaxID=225844 RepID=UPI001CD5CFE6|nr:nucleoside triphosphate pyrophosphohydrolase [Alkalihalobacillus algicola]MCA0987077.1 nucleoside triphosphate pyrophosphohydrolase [Alkalihalobacillus algicola]
MPVYNKLVRDRIPEIIAKNGQTYEAINLSEGEFKVELRRKLLEEVNEYLEASSDEDAISELCDVIEVVRSLAGVHGKSYEDVEMVRGEKEETRGVFAERVFLKSVEE